MSNVTPASTVKPACVNCLELIDKICPRCFKCKTCCDHTNSEFTKLKGTNAIIRRIPEKSILLTHHLTPFGSNWISGLPVIAVIREIKCAPSRIDIVSVEYKARPLFLSMA